MQKFIKIFTNETSIFLYMLAYLILGFMTICPFLSGIKFVDYYSHIVKFWGIVLIIACAFNKEKYRLNKYLIIVILFIASYFISCFFSIEYGGFFNNFKGIIWILIQALFFGSVINKNMIKVWFPRFLFVFLGISTIQLILSLVIAVIGLAYIPTITGSDVLWFGMLTSRNYGIYKDPTYGSICCCLSIYAILYIAYKYKFKTFAFALILLNLIYISLSGSRTVFVAFCISILCFSIVVVFCAKSKDKKISTIRKWVFSITTSSVIVVLVLVFILCVNWGYQKVEPIILKNIGGSICSQEVIFSNSLSDRVNSAQNLESLTSAQKEVLLKGTDKDRASDSDLYSVFSNDNKSSESNTLAANGSTQETDQGELSQYSRGDADISNNRFALWASFLKVWKLSPIFGFGRYNVLNYINANLTDSRAFQMQQTTSHNVFIDVLYSQGLVGLILFVTIILITLSRFISLIKRFYHSKMTQNYFYVSCVFAMFLSILLSGLFYPEIIYINTVGSAFFWIIVGIVYSEWVLSSSKKLK